MGKRSLHLSSRDSNFMQSTQGLLPSKVVNLYRKSRKKDHNKQLGGPKKTLTPQPNLFTTTMQRVRSAILVETQQLTLFQPNKKKKLQIISAIITQVKSRPKSAESCLEVDLSRSPFIDNKIGHIAAGKFNKLQNLEQANYRLGQNHNPRYYLTIHKSGG